MRIFKAHKIVPAGRILCDRIKLFRGRDAVPVAPTAGTLPIYYLFAEPNFGLFRPSRANPWLITRCYFTIAKLSLATFRPDQDITNSARFLPLTTDTMRELLGMILVFLSSQTMGTKILLSTLVWGIATPLLKHLFHQTLRLLCTRPMPPSRAFIPFEVPHPNPPGSAVLFDLTLESASDKQIMSFMTYRGRKWARTTGLGPVATEAAAYKGHLYEERTMKWIDEHFRLHLPNLKYPYAAPRWNGWVSFWTETAPQIREMFVASMFLTFEHVIGGVVLPMAYLLTQDPSYFELAMYSEIGMQMVLSVAILFSYAVGADVTVEQMHPSVWPLLLIHHACTASFCILCLNIGDDCPREEVAYILLVLLGLTSSLHYVSQMLDFSPLSQSNAPYTRLINHAICLSAQIIFRGVVWFWIVHSTCWKLHAACGPNVAASCFVVSLLFTAFNFDFIKFHYKATIGCYRKIQSGSRLKVD